MAKKTMNRRLAVTIEADSALMSDCVSRRIQEVIGQQGLETRGPIPLRKQKSSLESPAKEIYGIVESIWSNVTIHSRMIMIDGAGPETIALLNNLELPSTIRIRFSYR